MTDDSNHNFSDDCFFVNEISDTEYPIDDCFNSFLSKDNANSINLLYNSNRKKSKSLNTKNHQKSNMPNINLNNHGINIILQKQYSQNLIFQHFQIDKKNSQIPKTSCNTKKKVNSNKNSRKNKKPTTRKRVKLTEKAIDFRDKYYLIFTHFKKFPERFVIGIHNIFLKNYFNMPQVERYQYRSINNYFQSYCDDSEKILQYLMINKRVIQLYFPELINEVNW